MESKDSGDTITISGTYSAQWSDIDTGAVGVTAQTIDLNTVTLSSQPAYVSIGSSAGSNGIWGAAGTVTLTDPYEEMEKRLRRLEEIIEEEQRIRDECPAVKNAYDEYRLLLVLAKQHTTNVLTDE